MIPGLSLIGAGTDSCINGLQDIITSQGLHAVEVKDSCLIKGFYIRTSNNFDYGIWNLRKWSNRINNRK